MTTIAYSTAIELWNGATRRLVGVLDDEVVCELTALGGAAVQRGAPLALHEGAHLARVDPAFYARHGQVATFLRQWADGMADPGAHELRALWDQSCRMPVGLQVVVTPLGGAATMARIPLTLSLTQWHSAPGMPVPAAVEAVQAFLRCWADALVSRGDGAKLARPEKPARKRAQRDGRIGL